MLLDRAALWTDLILTVHLCPLTLPLEILSCCMSRPFNEQRGLNARQRHIQLPYS
jgi:hypothetical protein